jgi:fatty-acyl-CoA synthase
MGSSSSGGGGVAGTAEFTLAPGAKVFDGDDREIAPGSGEIGMLAVPGHLPIGYYKDPEKSGRTFRTINDVRYSIAGDYATIEEDGMIRLLGRGSGVINTGGEKVFPEEVEEVLKLHPGVRDAACVALPDERFGEKVCAIIEPEPDRGVSGHDEEQLIAFVEARLAGYKAPRSIFAVASIGRSPIGKVDYPMLSRLAKERAGLE